MKGTIMRQSKMLSRWLSAVLLCVVSLGAAAQATEQPHDTVMVYNSWQAIFDNTPTVLAIDPYIEAVTPFTIVVDSRDAAMHRVLTDAMAITVADHEGGTIWLMNTDWLNAHYEGDCDVMAAFVPLFFNEKVAFLHWSDTPSPGMFEALFGGVTEVTDEDYYNNADYYVIDVPNRYVTHISRKTLPQLLSPYHDLLMRYQGMKNYKKQSVVNYFFNEWVQRATADPFVPTLY